MRIYQEGELIVLDGEGETFTKEMKIEVPNVDPRNWVYIPVESTLPE
jgi:hypothetical protein